MNRESHEVGNLDSSVVTVVVCLERTRMGTLGSTSEWVGNNTVTSLESDLGLEGVLTDGTDHAS